MTTEAADAPLFFPLRAERGDGSKMYSVDAITAMLFIAVEPILNRLRTSSGWLQADNNLDGTFDVDVYPHHPEESGWDGEWVTSAGDISELCDGDLFDVDGVMEMFGPDTLDDGQKAALRHLASRLPKYLRECGHPFIQKGCGGCDGAAIDFIINDDGTVIRP